MTSAATTWFTNAAIKVLGAFIIAFGPIVIAAGSNMLSLATLKAAAIGGIASALAALDALVGNVINPTSTGTVHALRVRAAQIRALEESV